MNPRDWVEPGTPLRVYSPRTKRCRDAGQFLEVERERGAVDRIVYRNKKGEVSWTTDWGSLHLAAEPCPACPEGIEFFRIHQDEWDTVRCLVRFIRSSIDRTVTIRKLEQRVNEFDSALVKLRAELEQARTSW